LSFDVLLLIQALNKSKLITECPHCRDEFNLSKSLLFDGMNKGQVENVTLLSNKTTNPHMKNFHKAIAEAIKNKSYNWKILYVTQDGRSTYK
jgi:hypothetical protein